MTLRYATPRRLEQIITDRLHRAGYEDAVMTKGTRYVREGGRACLKASVHQYSKVVMDLETLDGYERVLAEMPGVVRTEVIHNAQGYNPLRDQVIVIHLRMWNEADS